MNYAQLIKIMRTLKLLSILSFIILASCSNDDSDSQEPIKTAFPVQIVTSVASDTNLNTTMNIDYDSNNRISQYRLDSDLRSNTYNIAYDGEGKIITISHLLINNGVSYNYIYNFIYNNNIVSQVIRLHNESTTPFDVEYDASIKRYRIQIGTFSANYYTYDDQNNLTIFVNGAGTQRMTYNEMSGIFQNSNNNFALSFSLIFSNINMSTYGSVYFSNKELLSVERPTVTTYNVTSNRNANDQIDQMIYTDTTTSELFATTTITYELR